LAFSAVGKLIDAPAPSTALPSPFVMANAEALKQSFSHARFKDTKIETLKITFDFVHPESYTRFHQQITALIEALLSNHPKDLKIALGNSISEAVWQYADFHGRVNMDKDVIFILGKIEK
jgi:hypothetical protein